MINLYWFIKWVLSCNESLPKCTFLYWKVFSLLCSPLVQSVWCSERCFLTLKLVRENGAGPSPLPGDMAIRLLRGEPGRSLSDGMYLFLLPRSPCCYKPQIKGEIKTVKGKIWFQLWTLQNVFFPYHMHISGTLNNNLASCVIHMLLWRMLLSPPFLESKWIDGILSLYVVSYTSMK